MLRFRRYRVCRQFMVLSSIFLIFFSLSICLSHKALATTSTLTISIADTIELDAMPSTNGSFAASTATNNISVRTNNGTGYTLGIKASTEGSNALNKTGGGSIPSLTVAAGISESTYRTNTAYNNTWGFRPSKLNSASNSNYLPGPTSATDPVVLDRTSSANPTIANNYNLAIGTRVNSNTAPGSYSNTFVITVVANPIIYSITYNKNTTDSVTNMPANVINQETISETVNIASQVPVRDDYIFKGWCTTQTADGGTCSGTTYNPYGGGTALTWILNQTVSSNSLALYAVWESVGPCKPTGTTILTIVCMQDISANNKSAILNSMTQGTQYRLIDRRDSKEYYVAKLPDGNIWMTQNLDLDLSTSTTLTPANTDIPANWTPSTSTYSTGTTVWNNSGTAPESYNPGDRCWNGTITNSWSGTVDNMTIACNNGNHYHIGNYYNWTAAIAMNDSSSYSSENQDANQSICPAGWRLPTRLGDKSYDNLVNALSLSAGTSGNIQKTPVYFPYAGTWYGGSSHYIGSDSRYWSSVNTDSKDAAHILYFSCDNEFWTNSPGWKGYGDSVRCVAR